MRSITETELERLLQAGRKEEVERHKTYLCDRCISVHSDAQGCSPRNKTPDPWFTP